MSHELAKSLCVQRVKVTGTTVELHVSTHSSGNLSALHGKRIDDQSTLVGISLGWDSDCDDRSTCWDHCVCTSGNAPSRNGHPNAPVLHHTTSEYPHSNNNGGNGNSADEEKGVIINRYHRHGIFQYHVLKSFTAISKA